MNPHPARRIFCFICRRDSAQAPANCTARLAVLFPVNTAPLPAYLTAQPDGVLLAVKLQPRASKNEIGGVLGNELRIKVTAPPVDAAANEALVRLLAETLDCPRGKVELVRGHTSRHKTIKLHGMSAATVAAKLA
jgi:uncharacterized protein (TIGR00251 family)